MRGLRFWKLDRFEPRQQFQIPDHDVGGVCSLIYSPNGRMVASGCYDRIIRLWDAESGSLIRELVDDEVQLRSDSGVVHLDSGRSIDTDMYAVRTLAFSPDGSILASGRNDGIIRLWNTDPRFDRARARIKALSDNEKAS